MRVFAASDWQLSADFLALCLVSIVVMKVTSLSRLPAGERKKIPFSYLLSPLYAVTTWRKCRIWKPRDLKTLFLRFGLASLLTFVFYEIHFFLIRSFEIPQVLRSYLAFVPFYALTESLGALAQILFLPTGRLMPPTHQNPLASKSISEFWARRWNPWMSDWFKQIFFPPFKNKAPWGVVAVFAFSGLWHEILINVPLYFQTGTNLLGTMVAYFSIQCGGVILDKRLLKPNRRFLRICFGWLVVIAPVPLFLNEASLKIFQLFNPIHILRCRPF